MDNNQNQYDQNQNDQNQQNQNYQQSYAYQQPLYQQPAYQQPPVHTEPPMTIGEWLLLMLIMIIPCVNIIMLFVWAFSGDPNKISRANYCKAMLIWILISIVLSTILTVAFGAIFASFFEDLANELMILGAIL